MLAFVLFGLYVERTPRPMAIPKGVVSPYSAAAAKAIQLYCGGSRKKASREPKPKPSNISIHRMSASIVFSLRSVTYDGRQ